MKTLHTYIYESLKIKKGEDIRSVSNDVFAIGDEAYRLKRHVKHRIVYYEIVKCVIEKTKMVTIVQSDKSKRYEMHYKFNNVQGWSSIAFKTFDDAKQYCKDKNIKLA